MDLFPSQLYLIEVTGPRKNFGKTRGLTTTTKNCSQYRDLSHSGQPRIKMLKSPMEMSRTHAK
jgi:hypothetical protein